MSWQMGVAFIKGINVYGSKRISQRKMLELCKSIEDENLKIVQIVKTDNIIFEKKNMHYASVSSKLERVLSDYFGKPVYVTSRSIRTIRLLLQRSKQA